jgi:DNA repair protein RadC
MRAGDTLNGPHEAWQVAAKLVKAQQETFVVIMLNARNGLIGAHVVAIGTVSSVEVHPRDVFREAVRRNAAGIVVAHNHPTGNVEPSPEDHLLTARLVEAGKVLGIPVVDHLIVGSKRRPSYLSFSERGVMP